MYRSAVVELPDLADDLARSGAGDLSMGEANDRDAATPSLAVTTASPAPLAQLIAGDFNHDNQIDIVARGPAGDLSIYLATGGGAFASPRPIGSAPAASQAWAGDLDGDRTLDVVLLDGSDVITFLRGDGDGSFAPPLARTVGEHAPASTPWAHLLQPLCAEQVDSDARLVLVGTFFSDQIDALHMHSFGAGYYQVGASGGGTFGEADLSFAGALFDDVGPMTASVSCAAHGVVGLYYQTDSSGDDRYFEAGTAQGGDREDDYNAQSIVSLRDGTIVANMAGPFLTGPTTWVYRPHFRQRSGTPPSLMLALHASLAGDFDGDGADDIYDAAGQIALGPGFSRVVTTPALAASLVGDFDGDGRDDLVSMNLTNFTVWLSR